LPTGITEGVEYYVINKYNTVDDEQVLDVDAFYIATSYANAIEGTKIVTTGSQSGTHGLELVTGASSSTYEEIDYGTFKVVEEKVDMENEKKTLKLFDKMYESLQLYTLTPTYPLTMKAFLEAICTELGWTLGTSSFTHDDLSITAELFGGQGLTYRQILEQIAEASATVMYFNTSDELILKTITNTPVDTITPSEMINFKLEPEWGELNSVVLSRMPQEDNIVQKDDASIVTYGLNEFKIINNAILDGDRATYIGDIYTDLLGLKYYPFESQTIGLGYYEVGDMVSVTDLEATTRSVLITDVEITIDGGFTETLKSRAPDKSTTPYDTAGIIGQTIKNTQIIVDRQQGEIDILTAAVAEGGIPRQADAPADPEVNDLWLDTDNNIIYIWDGSEWQPTSIDPASLADYYTKDETIAQITLTADQINLSVQAVQTVANSALSQADTNSEDIVVIQSDVTQLNLDVDSLDIAVTGVGGSNLLKNSTGLKGTIEEWQEFDEAGALIDADNDGTVVQTTDVENNSESGSAIQIDEQFITQTIPTLVDNTYTFYCRFNKLEDCDLAISGIAGAIPITAGSYVDETWAVFKYQFTATTALTTINISNVSSGAGAYCILADMVCKIGDVNGWVQAPNEVYGKNFKFDKDGFSVTSLTDYFKAVLDNVKLGIYDTSSGADRIMALFGKDASLITQLTAQDEFILQRYQNSASSTRFIPTATGSMIVVNNS